MFSNTGLLKKEDLSEGNFSGRKNADENWVLQRGEQGKAQNSSSSKYYFSITNFANEIAIIDENSVYRCELEFYRSF